MQRTLTELKRLGDDAFAAAQDVIDDAHRIVRDCKRMTAKVAHSKYELERFTRQSRKVTLFRDAPNIGIGDGR